jgi:NADH-ubiquinone oxidoreductase chain 4
MIVEILLIMVFGGVRFGFRSINLISATTFILVSGMMFMVGSYTEEIGAIELTFFSDGLRVSLSILRLWVSLLILYSSYKIIKSREYEMLFSLLILILLAALLITFFVGDYIMFYFFFEVSLIPTLLIIMGWGYQPERLQAGVYFLFYTLTASLPLLAVIIYMWVEGLQLTFSFTGFNIAHAWLGRILFWGCMGAMAFLVKLPIYFTHLWLPRAHVEAPVAGSMILAGVLLKLGGYGLLRVSLARGYFLARVGPYFLGLSLAGMLYVGLICCRLNDFKALVAYSSVAHIALVISGVLAIRVWGFMGALVIIIGHGLSSSGLFCIVNIYYERMGRRSFYINKGLILAFPTFSIMIFFLCAANIAAPPTINLISEIFLMARIINYDYLMLVVFPIGSFLGAVFTLFIFSFSQHGLGYYLSYSYLKATFREVHTLFLHVVPVNFIILNSSLLLSL